MVEQRKRWLVLAGRRGRPAQSSVPSVALLTRYEQNGASSRIRLHQFRPVFEEQFTVVTQSLLSNRYVDALNRGQRLGRLLYFALGMVRRVIFTVRHAVGKKKFDLLILEQEYLTYLPTRIELFLLRLIRTGPLVIDVDDANFFRYVNRRGLVARLCGGKHGLLWHEAEIVVCGSTALQCDVEEAVGGVTSSVLIPSVPPSFHGQRNEDGEERQQFRIGWIGSPSTAQDLALVKRPLQHLSKQVDLEFLVVGATIPPIPGVPTVCMPWSLQSETAALESMDIGVMPVLDDQFRRRKCSFKIAQYMGAGIPVVASDVGGNLDVLNCEGRQGGIVVRTEEEWVNALKVILKDRNAWKRLATDGRWISERFLSYQVAADGWSSLLANLRLAKSDEALLTRPRQNRPR